MKLRAVHTYQTIKFSTKNHNFLMDSRDLGLEGLTLTYLPDMQAIRATVKGKDDILIFCTNVAYAIPADAELDAAIIANRGKIKNVDTSKAVKG